jgi:hypothetical protein
MQTSLFISAIMTWLLARQGPELVQLLPILLFYGCATYSRNTLTQAIVADSASEDDRDAAFSLDRSVDGAYVSKNDMISPMR